MKGTIKRLNVEGQEQGYGFIAPEEGGDDVFFHSSECPAGNFKDMKQGNSVTFEKGTSPKGPRATNVTLA